MSLVVIEGPDGAGKTTLAARLEARYAPGSRVVHFGAYAGQERIAHHYLDALCEAFREPERVTVMDRSWLSEPVYGQAARGGQDRVSPRELAALNAVANGCGAVVVLCLPPLEACREAWRARLADEYLKRESQLAEVWRSYSAATRLWRGSLSVVLYDRTHHAEEAIAEQVDHFAGRSP